MIKLFLFFLFVGALAAWRGRTAMRMHNRRLFPSMQVRAPLHMRPFLWLTLLGAVLAAVVEFIHNHS